ncbi:hypothetical protein MHM39_15385 [Phaeobacter sp. CNT1-3]|nr:hypothetical protein [Phaeobacter sp. CNT1-3]
MMLVWDILTGFPRKAVKISHQNILAYQYFINIGDNTEHDAVELALSERNLVHLINGEKLGNTLTWKDLNEETESNRSLRKRYKRIRSSDLFKDRDVPFDQRFAPDEGWRAFLDQVRVAHKRNRQGRYVTAKTLENKK